MYCNITSPKCKIEVGFSNFDELIEFKKLLEVMNSISKKDYSNLIQQTNWLVKDFERMAGWDQDIEIPFDD